MLLVQRSYVFVPCPVHLGLRPTAKLACDRGEVHSAEYGTVPTVWYSTNSVVQYQQYGTVPTVCMVQYQQYVWYSTNSMVQYQRYGTVPTVCMVDYQQYVW